jgi:molybdate transport system substrate-binding protein
MKKAFVLSGLIWMACLPASAAELHLLAAGSLRDAMTKIAAEFEQKIGISVVTEFGHSGLMREKVENGDPADVFASADMGHPRKLLSEGRASLVAEFVRNSLCVVGSPKAKLNDENVLAKMLDPSLTLGIFPPKEDPAGDYSLVLFKRAEAVQAGAENQLNSKAKIVSGSMVRGQIAKGEDYTIPLFREGTIDLLISYCSGAYSRLRPAYPELTVAKLPAELSVGADYGLALVKGSKPEAAQLALFILSSQGQSILNEFGFSPIGLPN